MQRRRCGSSLSNKHAIMKYLFALLFAGLMISCNDDEETPECILTLSDEFATTACSGVGELSGDLTIWRFDGEDVYCFNEGDCIADAQALIYDEDCFQICTLGGPDGNDVCRGLVWSQNATLAETVLVY